VQVCFGAVLAVLGLVTIRATQAPSIKLSGTVVTAAREPVLDAAVVLLTAAGELPELPALREIRLVSSPEGRFEWPAVPAGDYRLVVASAEALKDWPAEATVERFAQRGFPLTLTAGQPPVQLLMVVDVGAAPARDLALVNVSVSTIMMVGGSDAPPPGAPRRPGAPTSIMPRPMSGPSTISGVVTDADGRPLAGVRVQAGRRQTPTAPATSAFLPTGMPVTTDATGAYRIEGLQPGDYVVAALSWAFDFDRALSASVRAIPAETDASGQRTAAWDTYFPGVASTRAARVVAIEPGETSAVDFAVLRGPVATMVVRLGELGPRGPGSGLAYLMPASVPEQFGQRNQLRAVPDAAGDFTFVDLQPGAYLFTHFAAEGWVREPVTVAMPPRPAADSGTAPPVVVALAMKPYLTVSGRVDLRPTRVSGGPSVLTTLKVSVTPSPLTAGSTIQIVPVSADGSFTIPRVPGGPATLGLARGEVSWVPLAAVMNGQDSLDRPVDIRGNVSDASLVVTDLATTVQGTVIGRAGGRVVVFSSDHRFWTPGGSRRVRVVSVLPGGVFTVSGLPPGTYHAAAFPPGTRIVNSALEEAKGRTAPFDLAIGEQKHVVVR
jgi:hypothetical protein